MSYLEAFKIPPRKNKQEQSFGRRTKTLWKQQHPTFGHFGSWGLLETQWDFIRNPGSAATQNAPLHGIVHVTFRVPTLDQLF